MFRLNTQSEGGAKDTLSRKDRETDGSVGQGPCKYTGVPERGRARGWESSRSDDKEYQWENYKHDLKKIRI